MISLAVLAGLQVGMVIADVVDVDASLDPEAGRISGQVDLSVRNLTDAPLDRVYLWLYPNRFRERSSALDDVTFDPVTAPVATPKAPSK